MLTAQEALDRLVEGNRRFVAGRSHPEGQIDPDRRRELVEGQEPFAIVLGCSDSRVPAEMVFDQGLGDLFVIRVAGHVAAPSQIASIEFAAERFGTRLVMVLGHSRCGAVSATIEACRQGTGRPPGHLPSIVDRIRPSVEPFLAGGTPDDDEALVEHAVRAHVRRVTEELRHDSDALAALTDDGLAVVGAEYALETGRVEILDGLPAAG